MKQEFFSAAAQTVLNKTSQFHRKGKSTSECPGNKDDNELSNDLKNLATQILNATKKDLSTIDCENMLEHFLQITHAIQIDISKLFEKSKNKIKITDIFDSNFEVITNYFVQCLQRIDTVKASIIDNLNTCLGQFIRLINSDLLKPINNSLRCKSIAGNVFSTNEEFVALINSLSTVIKELMKQSKICIKELSASIESQSNLSKNNTSGEMSLQLSVSQYKKKKSTEKKLDIVGELKREIGKNIKNMEGCLIKFYEDAKFIFKRLKILHAEKAWEVHNKRESSTNEGNSKPHFKKIQSTSPVIRNNVITNNLTRNSNIKKSQVQVHKISTSLHNESSNAHSRNPMLTKIKLEDTENNNSVFSKSTEHFSTAQIKTKVLGTQNKTPIRKTFIRQMKKIESNTSANVSASANANITLNMSNNNNNNNSSTANANVSTLTIPQFQPDEKNALTSQINDLTVRNRELLEEIAKLHETYVTTHYENENLKRKISELKALNQTMEVENEIKVLPVPVPVPVPMSKEKDKKMLMNTSGSMGNTKQGSLHCSSITTPKLTGNTNMQSSGLITGKSPLNLSNADNLVKLAETFIGFIRQTSNLQAAIGRKSSNLLEIQKEYEVQKREIIQIANDISKYTASNVISPQQTNANELSAHHEEKENFHKFVNDAPITVKTNSSLTEQLQDLIVNHDHELNCENTQVPILKDALHSDTTKSKSSTLSGAAKLKDYENKISQLKKENEQLKQTLSENEHEIGIMNEKAHEYIKDIEILRSSVVDKEKKISELGNEKLIFKKMEENLKFECNAKEIKIKELESLNENTMTIFSKLQAEKEELANKFSIEKDEMTKVINSMKIGNEHLAQASHILNKQISDFKLKETEWKNEAASRHRELLVTIEHNEKELERLTKKNEELIQEHHLQLEELRKSEQKIQLLTDHHKTNIIAKETENRDIKYLIEKKDKEITDLENKIGYLTESISTKDSQIKLLEQEKNIQHDNEIKVLESKIEKLIEDHRVNIMTKDIEMQVFQAIIQKKSNEVKELTEKLNQITEEYDIRFEDTVKSKDKDLSEFHALAREKENQVNLLNLDIAKHQLAFEQKEKEITQLEKKIEVLTEEHADQMQHSQEAKDDLVRVLQHKENEVKNLEVKLQDLTVCISAKDFELGIYQAIIEKERNKSKDTEKKIQQIFDDHKATVSKMNSDMKEFQEIAEKKENEVQELREKVEKKNGDIQQLEMKLQKLNEDYLVNRTAKDFELQIFQGIIEKKAKEVRDIQAQIEKKDTEITRIQQLKDAEINELANKIDRLTEDFRVNITTKDIEIHIYQSVIEKKSLECKEKVKQLTEKHEKEIENLNNEINQLNFTINKISQEKEAAIHELVLKLDRISSEDQIKHKKESEMLCKDITCLSSMIKTIHSTLQAKQKELRFEEKKNIQELRRDYEMAEGVIFEELELDSQGDSGRDRDHSLLQQSTAQFNEILQHLSRLFNYIETQAKAGQSQCKVKTESESELIEENKKLKTLFNECTQAIYESIKSSGHQMVDDELDGLNISIGSNANAGNEVTSSPISPPATQSNKLNEAEFIRNSVDMFKKYNTEIREVIQRLEQEKDDLEIEAHKYKIMAETYKQTLEDAMSKLAQNNPEDSTKIANNRTFTVEDLVENNVVNTKEDNISPRSPEKNNDTKLKKDIEDLIASQEELQTKLVTKEEEVAQNKVMINRLLQINSDSDGIGRESNVISEEKFNILMKQLGDEQQKSANLEKRLAEVLASEYNLLKENGRQSSTIRQKARELTLGDDQEESDEEDEEEEEELQEHDKDNLRKEYLSNTADKKIKSKDANYLGMLNQGFSDRGVKTPQSGMASNRNTEQNIQELLSEKKELEEKEQLFISQLATIKQELKETRENLRHVVEENQSLKEQLSEAINIMEGEKAELIGILQNALEKIISEITLTSKVKEFLTVILRVLGYSDEEIVGIYQAKEKKKSIFNIFK